MNSFICKLCLCSGLWIVSLLYINYGEKGGGGDCLTQQDWEEIESSKILGKQWLILHCNYYQIQLKKQADTNYEHYPTLLLAISQLVFTFLWNVWRIL